MAAPGPIVLKTVVFLGSARSVIPPWGGDARLGDRVLKYVLAQLQARTAPCGPDTVSHEVEVLDPKDVFGPGGPLEESGAEIRSPTFFTRSLSPEIQEIKDKIVNADCYLIVSPEYNHSIPPALTGLMGHFGGSCYKYKPSGIVTYSVGPWGGARAAMALRPFLSELGCLPVSPLVGIPTAQDFLKEDGTPADPTSRLLNQLPGLLDQLEFLAVAMKRQRDYVAAAQAPASAK